MTNSAHFLLGEADFTHATQDTDHGALLYQRITMTGSPRRRRKGAVCNITYPLGKAPLLYNQVVSPRYPMPMDTLNTLLQTRP
jgi:hypothetical protein